MRQIKFRGRDTESGEFVYAEMSPDYLTVINDDGIFTVDLDSIAQLVGYDSDGNEVYEGDTLLDADGCEWIVEMTSAVISGEGFIHDIPLDNFKLKEAQQ